MADNEAEPDTAPGPGTQAYEHAQGRIRRMNEFFYQSDPGEHFQQRAVLLLALADNTTSVIEGEFTAAVLDGLGGWEIADSDPLADREARLNSVAIDSLMLGYQAVESFLRQLFAHLDAGSDSSPWFALSAQAGPEAKKLSERLSWLNGLSGEDMRALVEWLFVGDLAAAIEATGVNIIDDFCASIDTWIRYLSQHAIEFRNTYNAAKHGLSTIPSNAHVSFAAPQEGSDELKEHVLLAGPTLESLEYTRRKKSEGGGVDWRRVTHVIDPVIHVRITVVAAELLTHMWTLGKNRHIGTSLEINVHARPLVSDVLTPRERHIPGRFEQPLWSTPLPAEQAADVAARIANTTEDSV